jgi:4-hydroxy-2-oxoheptanedioate aldolase
MPRRLLNGGLAVTNRFKEQIAKGNLQIGLWSSLAGNISAEIIAHSGYDWIVIDMEHAPNDLAGVVVQLQAMATGTALPIVRAPWNDFVVIKRLLDAGAKGLLLPYVQNRAEAEAAVAAIRYPGRGIRGVAGGARSSNYGRVPNYLKEAENDICLILQVETAEAMANLEEIASVDGVDGIFIGPADLAASMGHLGDLNADEVQASIRDAAARLKKIGRASGILTTVEEDARRYIGWGFVFVAVGIDVNLLVRHADALAKRFKPT